MRSFVKRSLVVVGVISLLFFVLVIFLQTQAAKKRISSYVTNYLRREFQLDTDIGTLDYQFVPLKIKLGNFMIHGKRPGKFLEARSILMELPYSDLWDRTFKITKLTADIAYLNLQNPPQPDLEKLTNVGIQIDYAVIHGKSLHYRNLNLNNIAVSAKASAGKIKIEELKAGLGSVQLTARGALSLKHLEIDVDYKVEGDVHDVVSFAAGRLPVHGLIRTNGKVSGKIQVYRIAGNVTGDSIFVAKSRPFSVDGKYNLNSADQDAPLKFDLAWKLLPLASIPSLIQIPFRVGGSSSGHLYYSGGTNFKSAGGNFQFRLSPDRTNDPQLCGDLQGSFADGIIRLKSAPVSFRKGKKILSAKLNSGIIDLNRSSASMQAETTFKMIAVLLPEVKGTGKITGKFTANGTLEHPKIYGTLESKAFELQIKNRVRIRDGKFSGSISQKEMSVQAKGFWNGSLISVNVLIPFANFPGRIHVDAPSFPVASIEPDLHGTASVRIDANGKGLHISRWSGTAIVDAEQIRWQSFPIQISNPIELGLSRGTLTIPTTEIQIQNLLKIKANGRINVQSGSLDASFTSSGNLDLLSTLVPHLETAGEFASSIHLGGTFAMPDWRGTTNMDHVFLRSSMFPLGIEDGSIDANLNGHTISFTKISAQVAGGRLEGNGEITLQNRSALPYRFAIQVRDLGMNYPEDIRTQISADLNLSSQAQTTLLSGKIALSRLILTRNIDDKLRLNTTLLLDKLFFTPLPKNIPLHLQLQIKNEDPILISNNLGRIQAKIAVRVEGEASHPHISGLLQVAPVSKLFLQTRQFFVEKGNILLDGYGKETVPKLDLILSSKIQDDETKKIYEVKLPLSGPINNLSDLAPQSSPPLQPDQIYFLLLTGRIEAQLTKAESRFMREQLLAFYSAQSVLPVPEKIPQSATLSEVAIHPELISSERDPSGRILNGKDLFSGISMVYSVPLNRSDEQTWIANYKLRKNVAVRFVDQEDGTYSSNVQQNFRFGGPNKTTSSPIPKRPELMIQRIRLQNISPLSEQEVLSILQLRERVPFDYWVAQEKLFLLKAKLQQRGYLAPNVDLENNNRGELRIAVVSGEFRKMIFRGYEAKEKDLQHYLRWWREGFSETAVIGMIRQDLLSQLWYQGFHKAEVHARKQMNGEVIEYVFESIPQEKFDVELQLEGAQNITSAALKKELEAPEQAEVEALHDFGSFKQKLELVYLKHGFLDADVSEGKVEVIGRKIRKKIQIQEGRLSKIHKIVVGRNQQLSPELVSQLKLRPGQIYDSVKLSEDRLTIGRYYEERGYHNVLVRGNIRRVASNLKLEYDLKTGGIARIDRIIVSGNRKTDTKLIEGSLPFKAGEPLSQQKLAEGQKRLFDLQLFSEVELRSEPTTIPDRYAVKVDVVERGNYEFTYSGGFNSEKKLEGFLQISDWNLFGYGQSLSLMSKINSEDKIARLIYHVPDNAGLKWKTLISASYEKLEQPLFITRTKGVGIQHQLKFLRPFVLVADYRFDRVEVTEKDPTDVYYVGEAPVDVSRIGGLILADTRNDPLLPTKGTFLSVQTSAASSFLGSQTSFVKTYSQLYHYRSFGKGVWASGFRIGLASAFEDELIATERFFAGGSFSVRGFEKDRLGPRDPVWGRPMGGEAVFIINQEYRFPLPIHPWLHGAVFYDAGNVYNHAGDFNPFRLRHSAGLGLRFQTPVGIGRFDWGINLDPHQDEKRSVFHFALGQAF